MALVLRMKNVTVQNPNLMTLAGYFPNSPFGEIWLDFGAKNANLAAWNFIKPTQLEPNWEFDFGEFNNLKSSVGRLTGVRLSSSTPLVWTLGQFGDESGAIEPTDITDDYLWFGDAAAVPSSFANVNIDGLSPARTYDLEIYAHRDDVNSEPREAIYNANGVELQINATNSTSTFTLQNVTPDINGRISLNITAIGDESIGYLNFMKIIEQE